jgi:hypothetical protein
MENDLTPRSSFDNPSMPLRLTDTQNMEEIEQAVYGSNISHASMVSRNPLLSETHCRHLITRMDHPMDRAFLVKSPSFPADLLAELALSEGSQFVLGFIVGHPNANDETRALVALRGHEDISGWK